MAEVVFRAAQKTTPANLTLEKCGPDLFCSNMCRSGVCRRGLPATCTVLPAGMEASSLELLAAGMRAGLGTDAAGPRQQRARLRSERWVGLGDLSVQVRVETRLCDQWRARSG